MGEATKVARKRLGTWKREPRETTVPGGKLTYTVVVVEHRGQTWERPDTKEGRAEITAAIHAVERNYADQARVLRWRAQVSEMAQRTTGTAGDCLAKASDLLLTAVDWMRKQEG